MSDQDVSVSPGAAAAAFGTSGIDSPDFDLAGQILDGAIDAIDALLGKKEHQDEPLAFGPKGSETVHAIVQHLVVPSVAPHVLDELGYSSKLRTALFGERRVVPIDGKARAELLVSRAVLASAKNAHKAEGSEDNESLVEAKTDDISKKAVDPATLKSEEKKLDQPK